MEENVHPSFPEPKVTSSNVLFCPSDHPKTQLTNVDQQKVNSVYWLMSSSQVWPAGLLCSGRGVAAAAIEALQAACSSVVQRQAAAQLIHHIQVSRRAAQLQQVRLQTYGGILWSQQSGLVYTWHHCWGTKQCMIHTCICPPPTLFFFQFLDLLLHNYSSQVD